MTKVSIKPQETHLRKRNKSLLWKFYIIKTVILDIINTVFH